MPDRKRPAQIEAAGAVVWRPGQSGPEVALVHRPRYDDWSFPKGKREPGEHILSTAVREVAEETGMRVELGRRLRPARYRNAGRFKRVDYWAARMAEGDAAGRFVANSEIDELAWLPVAAARDRLSYPHDAAVLDDFTSGPPATIALILVRHTTARNKETWRDAGQAGDLARPLTPAGQAQAEHLAGLLMCFGPARVVSSAAQRCVSSLEPYAKLAGAEVETEPAFTLGHDDAAAGRPATGGGWLAARLRSLPGPWRARRVPLAPMAGLVAAGRPAVVCAHRENLPVLLAEACERLGALVPRGAPLAKGAFWVLQVSSGRLISAEQHHLSR